MAESRVEVRAYRVDWTCEEDGCGLPVRTAGLMHPCIPPKYASRCPNGHEADLPNSYPQIVYEEINA